MKQNMEISTTQLYMRFFCSVSLQRFIEEGGSARSGVVALI
jgi:hypothetical protein